MKSLHDQDHYEVLEVARGATREEIDRAYRVARDTYRGESLALYSIYGDREASVLRERVEEAYRVLSHETTRSAYDATRGPAPPEPAAASLSAEVESLAVEALSADAVASARMPEETLDRLSAASSAFRDLEADVEEESGEFDGAKLRRARLQRGFELDQIADVTKVSIANLRNLEEENFTDLPATVYVRGFVTAYARTIGLEPGRVVASYLPRVEAARSAQARSRLLGRR